MSQNNSIQKPIPLRIIFILNAIMAILPFVFYAVFVSKDISIEGLDVNYMLYTGFAYIISFALLVTSILKKQFTAFRILFGINFLIAIPAGAYIGMAVAVISFAISFNQKVQAYFKQ